MASPGRKGVLMFQHVIAFTAWSMSVLVVIITRERRHREGGPVCIQKETRQADDA